MSRLGSLGWLEARRPSSWAKGRQGPHIPISDRAGVGEGDSRRRLLGLLVSCIARPHIDVTDTGASRPKVPPSGGKALEQGGAGETGRLREAQS